MQIVAPENRVPEVTMVFWLIKFLAVTMGETVASYLAVNLGLGPTAKSLLMTVVLVVALVLQFRQERFVPWSNWLAVVETLVTDNLVNYFGVALTTTKWVFSVTLAVVFAVWYASERTLSIHEIFTNRREAFWWPAILLTFALGMATGELMADYFGLGYLATGILFGMIILSLAIGYFFLGLDPVLGFWLAHMFTLPLGASFADLLSQPHDHGGIGLGLVITSAIFLVSIVLIVPYQTDTRRGGAQAY